MPENTKNENGMIRHIRKDHLGKKEEDRIKCPIRPKDFRAINDLLAHVKVNQEEGLCRAKRRRTGKCNLVGNYAHSEIWDMIVTGRREGACEENKKRKKIGKNH